MKFSLGLNTDVSAINQPQGSWREAFNMLYSKQYEALANEDGFEYLFDLPGQPCGRIVLNNNDWVVFIAGGSYDEIGLVSNNTYTRILKTTSSTDRFNFSATYPIKGKFRISNRGERIITWIDDINSPKILNIDNLPFPVDVNKVPTQAGSINTLLIFSAGDPPTISTSLNQTGGFVKSGAYLFSCSYTSKDNTTTSYFTATGPVKVNDESTGSGTAYDGCPANTITSKSIKLTIDGVDERYKYLNIGVISVIGGETKFKNVGKIEIVPGTTTYTFTYVGNETTTDLLLEQLTVNSNGLYKTAKAITVLNDKLVLGNLSSREPFNYQSYANNISIKWRIQSTYEQSLTSNIRSSSLQLGGFRAFEVYAFYIVFRYKDGSYSPAYHIPGRQAISSELLQSSLATAQGFTAKKFQVEDTCSTDGTMSYWENESETYPSDFPDFANQKVRHHKFPSLNYIMTNASAVGYSSLETQLGRIRLPVLNFTASNVVIPSELANDIDGWQIYYAKRDVSNQTCVGQGHLIFAGQDSLNSGELTPRATIYNPSFNGFSSFPGVNSLGSFVPFYKPAKSRLTFHSPDLILNKPSFIPSYIRNEVKLTAISSSSSATGPIYQYQSGIETARMLIDYTFSPGVTAVAATSSNLLRKVSANNPLYMPGNVESGDYFNSQGNEYISLTVTNGTTIDTESSLPGGVFGNFPTTNKDKWVECTYLTNLCQLLTNVYSPFTTQSLVAATDILPVSSSTSGTARNYGDSYQAEYSHISTRFRDSNISNGTPEVLPITDTKQGIKVIRNYLIECNINIKMRHEGADNNSKYYGKSVSSITSSAGLINSLLDSWDVNKTQIIEFNTDYNIVNSFNPVFPRNTTIDTLSKFPYRIIISETNSNELADSGWKTFLPNNYKDIITTKGEITNLEAFDDALLIHVTNTLLRTVGTQKLDTSTERVTIGVGDIFDIPPKEILVSELGYLGNQNKFGCGVTKLGYVFFDVSQGKVFIVGKDITELSSKGLRNFFRDNFKNNPVLDNPYIDTGVTMCYDEKYNRLLLSKKGTNGFTISYSPDIQGFISFHDYIPDDMFNTRSEVYSFKGLKVYRHNAVNKATYYDGVHPSSLTLTFNDENSINKVFAAFKWSSEIIDSQGVSLFTKTLTKALIYNSYQCSGEIELNKSNVFNAETTWNFNKFYDVVINRSLPFMDANGLILSNLNQSMGWFKQRRFVDKWVNIKLLYDNTDQNTLLLYDVNALMKKSSR